MALKKGKRIDQKEDTIEVMNEKTLIDGKGSFIEEKKSRKKSHSSS